MRMTTHNAHRNRLRPSKALASFLAHVTASSANMVGVRLLSSTHMHVHTHSHARTHTHPHPLRHSHADTHTHTNTHTHTHSLTHSLSAATRKWWCGCSMWTTGVVSRWVWCVCDANPACARRFCAEPIGWAGNSASPIAPPLPHAPSPYCSDSPTHQPFDSQNHRSSHRHSDSSMMPTPRATATPTQTFKCTRNARTHTHAHTGGRPPGTPGGQPAESQSVAHNGRACVCSTAVRAQRVAALRGLCRRCVLTAAGVLLGRRAVMTERDEQRRSNSYNICYFCNCCCRYCNYYIYE